MSNTIQSNNFNIKASFPAYKVGDEVYYSQFKSNLTLDVPIVGVIKNVINLEKTEQDSILNALNSVYDIEFPDGKIKINVNFLYLRLTERQIRRNKINQII